MKGEYPATIVMVTDESNGADAIVAYKKAVKNMQDLDNPQAGFVLTQNSPSELLARVVKSDFNLPKLPGNWIIGANGAEEVYARFKAASRTEPKAYVLWEPFVSKALSDPEVHVLLSSNKLKGYVIGVVVASRKFLVSHPDLVQKFVENYFRSAYYYSQNGLKQLIVEDAKAFGQISDAEADGLVQSIQFKNVLENYAHFGIIPRQQAQGLETLEEIIPKVNRILCAGKGSADVQAHTLYYTNVLSQMSLSGFHPGNLASPEENIRGYAELPALSEEEWAKLISVGQMKINDLSFRRGTAELNVQNQRDLEALAGTLKSMPFYYLLVAGHARAEGDIDENKKLAGERAKAAAEFLINSCGISKNRIRTIAVEPSRTGGAEQSVVFRVYQQPY